MIVKVKLVGSGVPGDPYRVNIPTYQLIHGNITHGYALVNIPGDVHGLSEDDLQSEQTEDTTEGLFVPRLSGGAADKVHAYFDKRYPHHKGKFRVEHVG